MAAEIDRMRRARQPKRKPSVKPPAGPTCAADTNTRQGADFDQVQAAYAQLEEEEAGGGSPSPVRKRKQDTGCCSCCEDDTRVLEDYIFLCIAPPLRLIVGFASDPTNFSLLIYYFIGCVAYRYLEGWEYTDSFYFLTVTATTVGYGDMHPETIAGRLFISVFALWGITVVLAAMAPLVMLLHGSWRERLVGGQSDVDTSDPRISIEEINKKINYRRRYLLAMIGPFLVQCLGTAIYYFTIYEPDADRSMPFNIPYFGVPIDLAGVADGMYWAVVTMTTIGYGDLVPHSELAKLLATLYIPLAVIALADAVADIQMIDKRRAINETDFGKLADECLLRDAVRNTTLDGTTVIEPVLTEAEFLVDQLIENGLVDPDAVTAIRRQFAYLTRNANVQNDDERRLTTRLVYDEIRERSKKSITLLSAGAELMDVAYVTTDGGNPATQFKWVSYEEWKAKSWQLRVLAKAEGETAAASAEAEGQSASVNVMGFRML